MSVMLCSGIITNAFAEYLPVAVYATDTVAGYPSSLKTSLINPNQDVRFVVEKPDGAVVQIPAQADLEGVARADFYGHQTKIAGQYKVAVVYPGSPTSSPQSKFMVYPDQVSATQSTLHSTLSMAEAGKDSAFVVVTLYDQYRNPVPNHLVKLVSSRSDDKVDALQGGVSDNNGRANFKVSSSSAGISVFSAMDVSLNMILQGRSEIVFFQPAAQQKSLLSNLFAADIGGDGEVLPGPVDHFDIEGLPSRVKVGDELTMTITARDKDNNVAKNYTGTIIISVPDDDNATLPSNGEYTFKASDLGKFTFNLSLQFSKLGTQTVQVLDKTNFKIAGETKVEVVSKDAVVDQPVSSDVVIKSPVDGAELSTNLVLISGTGKENINLKVFDNDIKIGDTDTDSDGFFSYEAKNLDNGPHRFYVMTDDSKVSKSVNITIDTIAPVINSINSDAEGPVLPGTQITVTVQSEPNLDSAKIRLQGGDQSMAESASQPGTYTATITAPEKDGNFPVDIALTDALGNKGEYANKITLTVQAPQDKNPPQVQGLEGTAGDTLVDLTWMPVEDHERPIKNYEISYGTQMDKMDQKIDTQDNSAKWQLRGLTNYTQYFISIKAIDTQGLMSDDASVTIAVTPVKPDLCVNVDCGSNGTCSEGACVCNTGWSGLTCNVQEQVNTVLSALPYDSSAVISWPPFQGVQAYHYKIFLGFAPGQYSDYVITPDNQTTYTVKDLINNVPYYFAVAALDFNGAQISQMSQEVQATPSGLGLRPAAPSPVSGGQSPSQIPSYQNQLNNVPQNSQTGPEALWVIFGSVVFAYFVYHHKRKIIRKINAKS